MLVQDKAERLERENAQLRAEMAALREKADSSCVRVQQLQVSCGRTEETGSGAACVSLRVKLGCCYVPHAQVNIVNCAPSVGLRAAASSISFSRTRVDMPAYMFGFQSILKGDRNCCAGGPGGGAEHQCREGCRAA